ncbi:EBP domain protein [Blyttiomyces helicus]|uniref:EBP domain protein n=1 Tax=Blyttiomyces helicus TaxID=388810 RepID=A0A4P9WGI4_9FUNG|nr:EBP domain protein [Blyttiomyces helicus]|eukprot:RKO89576.1 EBP domain protein [Blyttiomyces helicus]
MSTTTNTTLPHPYYPQTLLLPHYIPPQLTMPEILTTFFGAVAVIFLASWTLATRRSLPVSTRLVFVWFVACGFIHGVLEGYFAFNNREIAGQTFFLAELWKEYAYSDSRYMSSDSFVVIMEGITAALWGPGSFMVAYAIYTNSPARHILQFLISTGQLYGDVLYYLTTLLEGAPHCSQSPFHFWFYFVFLNSFWIVIPLALMVSSARVMYGALAKDIKSKKE